MCAPNAVMKDNHPCVCKTCGEEFSCREELQLHFFVFATHARKDVALRATKNTKKPECASASPGHNHNNETGIKAAPPHRDLDSSSFSSSSTPSAKFSHSSTFTPRNIATQPPENTNLEHATFPFSTSDSVSAALSVPLTGILAHAAKISLKNTKQIASSVSSYRPQLTARALEFRSPPGPFSATSPGLSNRSQSGSTFASSSSKSTAPLPPFPAGIAPTTTSRTNDSNPRNVASPSPPNRHLFYTTNTRSSSTPRGFDPQLKETFYIDTFSAHPPSRFSGTSQKLPATKDNPNSKLPTPEVCLHCRLAFPTLYTLWRHQMSAIVRQQSPTGSRPLMADTDHAIVGNTYKKLRDYWFAQQNLGDFHPWKTGNSSHPDATLGWGVVPFTLEERRKLESLVVPVERLRDHNYDFAMEEEIEVDEEVIVRMTPVHCEETPQRKPGSKRFFAVSLDAEFGKCGEEFCLLEISLTDYFSGENIFHFYVEPEAGLTDFATQWSGVTAAHIENARKVRKLLPNWEYARAMLFQFVDANTIIIGHGLENDFRRLHLSHRRVIDTHIILPRFAGRRHGLQSLTYNLVVKRIQDSENGHNVYEDTMAARELVIWATRDGNHTRSPDGSINIHSCTQDGEKACCWRSVQWAKGTRELKKVEAQYIRAKDEHEELARQQAQEREGGEILLYGRALIQEDRKKQKENV